jgi:hypothetical protein
MSVIIWKMLSFTRKRVSVKTFLFTTKRFQKIEIELCYSNSSLHDNLNLLGSVTIMSESMVS